MSSRRLEAFRRSLGFRLNLWYSLLFTTVSLVTFGAIYLLVASTLARKDREILEARLKEYAALYDAGGLGSLRQAVTGKAGAEKLLVRLVNPFNSVLVANVPDDWIEVDLRGFDLFGNARGNAWVRIPSSAERDFTLASARLRDGSMLQVGRIADSRELLLDPFRRTFAVALVPIVLLSFAAGTFLAHRALAPVRHVVDAVQSIIRTGQFNARVPERFGNDDVAELTRLFNHMLERNGTLVRAMRESLDHVAHDLRTPLARLRGTAEMALRNPENPGADREALADCVEECDRVLTVLQSLMEVSEAEAGMLTLRRQRSNLARLSDEAVELYRYVAEERRIDLSSRHAGALELEVDPVRIRQAIGNLIDNALKYTPPGGWVEVRTAVEGTTAVVTVADTGPGIPPEEQTRIWDRLYRGDQSRSQRGLGLGLSLVRAIAGAHGGRATVHSQPGTGSTFRLEIPAARG